MSKSFHYQWWRQKIIAGGLELSSADSEQCPRVQESLQTMPIKLLKKIEQYHRFYEVLTVHGNLGADGEASKISRAYSPIPLLAPSLSITSPLLLEKLE